MASFVNNTIFTALVGGTGPFGVFVAALGYQSPAGRTTDGKIYRYRAQSADLLQWEIGTATASAGGTVFSRTVTSSSTGGSTVNFTSPPNVMLTFFAADFLQFDDAMSLTIAQTAQARANISAAGLGVVNSFTDTTEATGAGTTYAARFEGGVEIAKKLFIAGAVAIGAMTLANAQSALTITATQPTTPVTAQIAVNFQITGAGSAAFNNSALNVSYLAGYTGSLSSRAGGFVNSNAGVGSTLVPAAGSNGVVSNVGAFGNSSGVTTGLNIGSIGSAQNGDINVGVTGIAQSVKNSAKNIGVVGSAINTGTSPVQIGGWFSLNQTTNPTISAALIADNGAQTDPIFRARDNGTDVFVIADDGTVTLTSSAALTAGVNALLITATQPTTYASQQSGVNFRITGAGTSAVISNALLVQYLPGYTGNQQTRAVSAVNTSAGTGNTLVAGAGSNGTIGNFGAFTNASGASATGLNVGNLASASSGLKNVGVAGVTQVASNSGANIGVFGTSINTGTGTVHQSAGYFTLNGTAPDNTTPSAALIADNGAQTDPIFRARDNGTDVFVIADGGAVTASSTLGVGLNIVAGGGIRSVSATLGIGYDVGSGGTVTQATSKSTGVTLNKVSGAITMNAASLAATTTVSFQVTNSAFVIGDTVHVQMASGNASIAAYQVWSETGGVASGSFWINVRNMTAGALAEAVVIKFNIIKGSNS